MLGRTVCAGFVAFSALVGMANLAAADRSDLRPIGVCIDKPGTGTFVAVGVWTSCNDADGTARTKAHGDLPKALPEMVAPQASQSLKGV
jgi:hypothetical protein